MLAKIILFSKNIDLLRAFYRDKMELPVLNDDYRKGMIEFSLGNCILALHKAARPVSGRISLVFYTPDVSGTRDRLLSKQVDMDSIMEAKGYIYAAGRDPEGNRFIISNEEGNRSL